MMTDKQWEEQSGLAFVNERGVFAVHVDTAWALLRFFRTGYDWGTQEEKRRWAEEEFAAFLGQEKAPASRPRPVPK